MNLNSFDLNLLRVFDALLKERSVTRAGARIGLSQPAVSAALGRLRHAFHDELFVRAGAQMVPTTRAAALAESVSEALASLEAAFARYSMLEPKRLERSYTLLGADFFSMLFMPKFAAALAPHAPGVRLRLIDASRGDGVQLLREGTVDVVLEYLSHVPDWISHAPLFRSCFVAVASRHNPRLRGLVPAEGQLLPSSVFRECAFAVYSLDGGETGCAVEALRSVGLGQRAVLALPHFQATAQAAADSDLVALMPCQFAEAVAERLDLAIYRIPVPMPFLKFEMYWHARADDDLQHAWLRAQIAETVTALGFEDCALRYLGPERATA